MTCVELFTGAGGLAMGLSDAGFHHSLLVEYDRHACETIRRNQDRGVRHVADWPLRQGDVCQVNFREVEGRVDLVAGGPPCQPFSLGGKHAGPMDARDMFPQAARAVRELRPKAFLFENVKGLTRKSFANYFEYIRLRLTYPEVLLKKDEAWIDHLARLERLYTQGRYRGLQYQVVPRLLNAADYGVPQRRERIFFVGLRADLGVQWAFPTPTHSLDALLWSQWHSEDYWDRHRVAQRRRPRPDEETQRRVARLPDTPTLAPWLTVRDALENLPDPETEPLAARAFHDHRFQPGARSYQGHTGSPLDEPAKTIKAGDHGVPGGENMLLRPDGSVRYFSIRESARLQKFPDDYIFGGSWTESMRQLGNAVPVTLAEVVARSISVLL